MIIRVTVHVIYQRIFGGSNRLPAAKLNLEKKVEIVFKDCSKKCGIIVQCSDGKFGNYDVYGIYSRLSRSFIARGFSSRDPSKGDKKIISQFLSD